MNGPGEDPLLPGSPSDAPERSREALLLEQIRAGDAGAAQRFVGDYYPRIYRYLLYLTGRREMAEDLTQETFLQAWRYLDRFVVRGSLGAWLHRIAHREFLQALRSERRALTEPEVASLEEIAAQPGRTTPELTEAVELRAAIGRLPAEEREAVVLHYLDGYTYGEIAQIMAVPVRRVKRRLAEARARLQRELGEGDLPYLNEPLAPMRQWAWLPLDQMHALETRLTLGGVRRWALGVRSECRTSNAQRLTPNARSEATQEETMERREFLRQAAVGAAGLMLTETEKEVVDSRLTQKVTCAFKGTALSDLCEKLKAETGVQLTAGPSVADEKVTLFCEKLPLREVMRQLSRPFGYTWLRSGQASGVGRQALGESPVGPNAQRLTPHASFRYELVQDLRSQLLEEELRNRDRNAALLALEKEIERFRPYLTLSPDEALERSRQAPPAEKTLLETLAGPGWGPIQMYFRLSSQDLASLRAGEDLKFSGAPDAGERPLPSDVARGVLQSLRDWRARKVQTSRGEAWIPPTEPDDPAALPLTGVPEVRATVNVSIRQSELGQFVLDGVTGYLAFSTGGLLPNRNSTGGHYAAGRAPMPLKPESRAPNPRLADDPSLRTRVSLRPHPSCRAASDPGAPTDSPPEPKVTTADVLEALHQATGTPIISDYYTHLYTLEAVSVKDQPLQEALGALADGMRLRWNKDGSWLQFRSATYYDDRLKEVPNRLLTRWAAGRRRSGMLTLDDLAQIAQLSDAQLDSQSMAEGAQECYGLLEWPLARHGNLRHHLRFLAGLSPRQRQEAVSTEGLSFTGMSLAQQQQFVSLSLRNGDPPLWESLEDLARARLRVEYTQPGWYEWRVPGFPRWGASAPFCVPVAKGSPVRHLMVPHVREKTPAAALEAAHRIDPEIRAALSQYLRWINPQIDEAQMTPRDSQIVPSRLGLVFAYTGGPSSDRSALVKSDHATYTE